MATNIQGPRNAPRQEPPIQGQDNPEIVCPVIRGFVNEGHLQVDAQGNAKVSQLKEIFEDLGVPRAGAHVSALGNRPSNILSNLWNGTFNVNKLRGGLLDHSGDSMILRNGHFDPARFAALISHSSDGKSMTMSDFKAAIRDNKKIDDASFVGSKISEIEFSLLLNTFGTQGADGQKRLSIEDLRGLYQDKKIPGDKLAEPATARPTNSMSSMATLARSLPSGSPSGLARAGMESAVNQSSLFTPAGLGAKGMGQGICPMMQSGGAQTTANTNPQIVQQHNQLESPR